jgi:hypothetical protein
MATPNLALIPSGYKAQKVYSVLPTNGDGDFTFSRSGSATRINKDGLIETVTNNVPRLDYSNGGCPSLLLEPERTNLITYSEDFSQSDWSVFDASKSANSVVSPDGTLNGARITALSGNNKVFQQLVTVSADPLNNRVFTGSIYIKSSSVTSCFLRVGSTTNTNAITISNEWQRFEAQYTLGATFTAVRLGIALNNEGDEVDVAFGQVEQGSYATSYIPTSGSAVTRLADTSYNENLANVIGQTEGTFYLETVPLSSSTDYTERVLQFGSSGSGFMTVQRYDNSNIIFYGTNGSNNWSIQGTNLFVGGETIKIAGAYKDNDIALYVNGVQIGTNTSANAPQTEKLLFANNTSGDFGYLGSHKDLKLYNTRLSNSELQALTSN